MNTLNINEKINVRSNLKFLERRSISDIQRSYRIGTMHKNDSFSGYDKNVLYYPVMPLINVNQLTVNKNFQISFK